MATTALQEKAQPTQGKAIQQPTQPYLPRTNFRFTDPTGFTADQWRLIAREPVNQMAQRFLQRELTALSWEITSDRKNDPRIDKYKKAWKSIFDGGQGYIPWLSRILSDVFTVPFGGVSEVGYKGGDLAYCNHVDAATVLPTYLKEVPYVQVNPDNWEQRVYFKPGELSRLWANARGEIRWKEYQRPPTEEAFMVIEALSKIYLYSMQELTDTPSMGILDLADMTKEEALDWANGFQQLLKGIDPFKIPVLYDHDTPANWIPFNRGPEELGINEQFRRYVELCLGFYGLSIGDLRLFERTATKAGERVSQMVTERSGVGYWAAIVAEYLTELLPDGLQFRYKQPRPERDKIVAERKAAQLNMLQAATGGKAFINVEDAVEEAMALEIFTTEVTALKPEDQPQPPPAPGFPQGGPNPQAGGRQEDETEEERDQRKDRDLSKADLTALEVKAAVVKALGAGWRHPQPEAQEALGNALQQAFTRVGDRVPVGQVEPIIEYVKRTLEALGEESPKEEPPEEKGGKGSGNWGHRGRPGARGGSAPGGGLGAIGAKRGHTAAERQAMSRRTRQRQGTWTIKPTAAGIRATVRAKQRARAAAAARRAEQTPQPDDRPFVGWDPSTWGGRGGDNTAIGSTTEAFGQDPRNRYEFRNRVVSLDSLITSNKPSGEVNPDYDPNLQPRERSRAASEMQIDNMARNMQPEALTWDFHQLDKGAPIVGSDHMVESGNGRILALQRARDQYPDQWANYQKTMQGELERAGIDPAKAKGIRDPVLVRERVTDVDRAEFAREANSAGVLQMSPLEKARNDARIISDTSLTNFMVGEEQSIDQALRAPANRAFVRNFVGSLPPNEAAALQRADGSLNRMGLWRVKAGMFSKTFPGESGDRLADTFFESVDHTTRNFENAIGDALPRLARVEGLIASGQRAPHLSLASDITAAIDMHARLKETGVSARNYVAQTSMFGRELTSSQERLLVHFSDASRSRKTIRETLIRYADAVERAPDPRQGAMFGGMQMTQEDLLAQVLGEEKGITAVMGILERRLEAAGIIKGGPTSGNWGHRGRPGARGGSAPGGGHGAVGIKPGHKEHDVTAILARRRKITGRAAKYRRHDPEGKHVSTRGDYFRDCSTGSYNKMCGAEYRARQAAEKSRDELYARIQKEGGARKQSDAAMVREDVLNVETQYNRKLGQQRRRLREAWDERAAAETEYWDSMHKHTRILDDGKESNYYTEPNPTLEPERYARFKAAEKRYEDSQTRAWVTQNRVDETTAERDEKIRRIVGVGSAGPSVEVSQRIDPSEDKRITADAAEYRTDKGMAFVNDMVTTEVDKYSFVKHFKENPPAEGEVPVYGRPMSIEWTLERGERAYASGNRIILAPTDGADTVVHEAGHYLERTNRVIGTNAKEFLLHRIQGEKVDTLKNWTGNEGYEAHEKAAKDRFMSSYMGKLYTWVDDAGPTHGNIRSTEIISMGLEYLYRKPVEFAKQDPEYFEFMIDTMNGRQWTPPRE